MKHRTAKYVGDEEARSLAYYMDHGLAKLVQVSDNACGGFDSTGISRTLDEREGDNHVYVNLYVAPTPTYKREYLYEVVLMVKDHDDFLAQIRKPLTIENWKELHKIYEELCIPEMMGSKILEELGFEY